jgi:leader peptidase (prepilin peptidase)/N-methyltransferase
VNFVLASLAAVAFGVSLAVLYRRFGRYGDNLHRVDALIVVASTAVLAALAAKTGLVEIVGLIVAVCALGFAGAVDVRIRIIPNHLLLIAAVGVAVLVCAHPGQAPATAAAVVGVGGLLLIVHLVAPDQMGFGDVKVAAVFGAYAGALGGIFAAFEGLTIALCTGAVAGLVVLALYRRRVAMPLGTFFALASLAVGWRFAV